MQNNNNDKSLEQWLWDAACSIRGAKDAPKYKDFILPLVFAKRLCDVFDDEVNRIAKEVGGRAKAFKLIERDHKLVRFYIPLKPANPDDLVWSVIRKLTEKVGEQLTDYLRNIARENPRLKGIIDRVDFNATTHGQRDISDDRLSALIEKISLKRLGLKDVEADIIGRSYEYLIRKFAEGSGQSAGEFYTPKEVGMLMARIMDPEPEMDIYDPCCGSAGLLIKCQLVLQERMDLRSRKSYAPLRMYGQEYTADTWAMANMNMIIHDMEGEIEIGDTFKTPKFRPNNKLQTFDRVLTNPMWNQDWYTEKDYDADELGRFPKGAGFPGKQSADWGWAQPVLASLNGSGRAAVVLDTGAASRGSGSANVTKEKQVRKWFVENDLIEGVIYLPKNLFYNTNAPGIILFLNKAKPAERKNKVFLLNASSDYEQGTPKNFISEEGIFRITETFKTWREEEKYSRVVTLAEVAAKDYNISPTRHIHLGEGEETRPVSEILDELEVLESESAENEKSFKAIIRVITK
jgi:type I restriction enzyme M protein